MTVTNLPTFGIWSQALKLTNANGATDTSNMPSQCPALSGFLGSRQAEIYIMKWHIE